MLTEKPSGPVSDAALAAFRKEKRQSSRRSRPGRCVNGTKWLIMGRKLSN
jgi:hypothetical protein